MVKVELHRAKNLVVGNTKYQKGKEYNVSKAVADYLLGLKDSRGIAYFRKPLSKTAAAEEAKGVDRMTAGVNVVKVEDMEDDKSNTPPEELMGEEETGSDEEEVSDEPSVKV